MLEHESGDYRFLCDVINYESLSLYCNHAWALQEGPESTPSCESTLLYLLSCRCLIRLKRALGEEHLSFGSFKSELK